MANRQYFKSKIFQISSSEEFQKISLELFRHQCENNFIYKSYIQNLDIEVDQVINISQIPFLPIEFFKTHEVKTNEFKSKIEFTSSGTSGNLSSIHHVKELEIYEKSFLSALNSFYPEIRDYCILALLPSYLERKGSSLIYMADHLIKNSVDTDSGFYLEDLKGLSEVLLDKMKESKPVLLLGVTFALLELAEKYPQNLGDVIIMETGGMKGRRKEMIREEVHHILKKSFQVSGIHSEYGMTELLSQAYALKDGCFKTPPWMKVMIRETTDPFSLASTGKTGGINVIDLANIDSCAFIETKDLGRLRKDDSFEVMGRFDNSDIRGCNLMVF